MFLLDGTYCSSERCVPELASLARLDILGLLRVVCGGRELRWLERTPDKREVVGSTPTRPTITRYCDRVRGVSSAGRAVALQASGHRFDPDRLHHFGLSARSEEHTSELQSLMRISYAVFCLKKKKQQ